MTYILEISNFINDALTVIYFLFQGISVSISIDSACTEDCWAIFLWRPSNIPYPNSGKKYYFLHN